MKDGRRKHHHARQDFHFLRRVKGFYLSYRLPTLPITHSAHQTAIIGTAEGDGNSSHFPGLDHTLCYAYRIDQGVDTFPTWKSHASVNKRRVRTWLQPAHATLSVIDSDQCSILRGPRHTLDSLGWANSRARLEIQMPSKIKVNFQTLPERYVLSRALFTATRAPVMRSLVKGRTTYAS